MATGDPVSAAVRLIKEFEETKQLLNTARSDVVRRNLDMEQAERTLGEWLRPKDMVPGEKIGVWFGDSLYQVELEAVTSYPVAEGHPGTVIREKLPPIVSYIPRVTIRTRGKHHDELTY